VSKDSPKKLSAKQPERLRKLLALEKDLETLRELKKSIPRKEKILAS
jgi:hypothetical protein